MELSRHVRIRRQRSGAPSLLPERCCNFNHRTGTQREVRRIGLEHDDCSSARDEVDGADANEAEPKMEKQVSILRWVEVVAEHEGEHMSKNG